MAYATGTATSPTNLLQSIVTFLVAAGWTQNMSQAEGSGWRAHLSKGGTFINFRAAVNENLVAQGAGYALYAYVGTGYSGASAWNAQAGAPVQSGSSTVAGAAMGLVNAGPYLNYHLFTDESDNVALVLERAAGIFQHICFGQVTKAGSWTGGAFCVGTVGWTYAASSSTVVEGVTTTSGCPGAFGNYITTANGYVRADVDAFTGKWLSIGNTSAANYGWTGKRCYTPVKGLNDPDAQIPGYGTAWQGRQTSDMNGKANLLPVMLWAERDAGGVSLIGQLPMVRFSNGTTKGYSIGQEETIGSDTWKFFPNFAVRKVA